MRAIFFNSSITSAPVQENWQKELADGVSSLDELCQMLDLDLPKDGYLPKKFPLKVPKSFVARMSKDNWQDPLLLQVLPDIAEQVQTLGYSDDPLEENNHNPIKGLLHKYKNRVLITVTGACAVHCRYCFRQHFDYGANLPTNEDLHAICDYIRHNDDVDEVLLSGGDPLSISNRRFGVWINALSAIDHVKTIRIHTRLPVVLPNRVDDELLELLQNCQKKLVMVLHINHAQEIDDGLIKACQSLKQAGVTLLNQTVLLKGVNDRADILCNLSHALFDAGVLPYYLHLFDKVQGAAHFDIDKPKAVALYWEMLANLSGYLVPKLVQELPDKPYKTPVDLYEYV